MLRGLEESWLEKEESWLVPIRMASIQNQTEQKIASIGEDAEKLEPCELLAGM